MIKEAKPFVIDKTLIYKAFLKVKENKGSAGVDSVSLEDYEKDLVNRLYKLWNCLRDILRLATQYVFRQSAGRSHPRRLVRVNIDIHSPICSECFHHLIRLLALTPQGYYS